MQLLLFSGPARTLCSKIKLTNRMYDPESSGNTFCCKSHDAPTIVTDDHRKYIQLLFDLKPSSESCEAITKVLMSLIGAC